MVSETKNVAVAAHGLGRDEPESLLAQWLLRESQRQDGLVIGFAPDGFIVLFRDGLDFLGKGQGGGRHSHRDVYAMHHQVIVVEMIMMALFVRVVMMRMVPK